MVEETPDYWRPQERLKDCVSPELTRPLVPSLNLRDVFQTEGKTIYFSPRGCCSSSLCAVNQPRGVVPSPPLPCHTYHKRCPVQSDTHSRGCFCLFGLPKNRGGTENRPEGGQRFGNVTLPFLHDADAEKDFTTFRPNFFANVIRYIFWLDNGLK